MEARKVNTGYFDKHEEKNIFFRQEVVADFFVEMSKRYSKKTLIYIRYSVNNFFEFLSSQEMTNIKKEIIFQNLTQEHIFLFTEALKNKVLNHIYTSSTAKNTINYVTQFLNYISEKNIIPFKIPNIEFMNNKKKYEPPPQVVSDFLDDLKARNYGQIDTYRKNMMFFLSYLKQKNLVPDNLNQYNFKLLNQKHFLQYEDFLSTRISLEEIKPQTALNYLRTVQLFTKYLYKLRLLPVRYSISDKFQVKYPRSNEYVPFEESIKLLKIIEESSVMKERNMCIFLLIVDTGCRPIEIVNLQVQDIRFSESTILFRSKKSGQRNLKISKPIMLLLKNYLKTRKAAKLDPLFLKQNGEAINTKIITSFFTNYNLKLYGEVKYTAKSLRHTLITNALDQGYSLDQVAQIAGHKYWVSTAYYLHRSKNRLLNNTINYNPVTFLNKY